MWTPAAAVGPSEGQAAPPAHILKSSFQTRQTDPGTQRRADVTPQDVRLALASVCNLRTCQPSPPAPPIFPTEETWAVAGAPPLWISAPPLSDHIWDRRHDAYRREVDQLKQL